MKQKTENYFIDFLRFIFSMCILFYHSWVFSGAYGNGILNHAYLAVDFYFIVTGYLMINSIYNYKKKKMLILEESFDFVYRKIKKLFPSLVAAFLVGVVFVYGKSIFFDLEIWLSNKLLPELFQLGIFGYELSVNSSWWYISAMIFVLALIYPVATKYKEYYCKYIAPLIIVFALGIVSACKININDPNTISFFFRNGFYKALIFIPLGNISYIIANKFKDKKFKKNEIIILSILEIIVYMILILNMHYLFMGNFVFAVLLMLNISLTFSGVTFATKIFKNKIWKKFGEYGFYVFLCNISIRTYMMRVYMNSGLSYRQLLPKFLILSCLTALFIYILVELIYKKIILNKIMALKNKKAELIIKD